MKKFLHSGLAALMMLFMTGFVYAAPQLKFTGYTGNKYGRYVPLVATLTDNGTPLQNFEVYYCTGGGTPSKANYDPRDESEMTRVIASGTTAEIFLTYEMVPYFQAIAYPAGTFTASNVISLDLTALEVAKPEFLPATPALGGLEVDYNTVVRIIDNAGGAEIYYSTDGETTPLKSAWEQSKPNVFKYDDAVGIKITKDMTIRAIAFKQINGQWAGSEMLRSRFTLAAPKIKVALSSYEYTIGKEVPTVDLTIPGNITLGTGSGNVAVELSCKGNGFKQIITQNNTPLDVSKAIAANREDEWIINCRLVKGENNAVAYAGDASITPTVISMEVLKDGERPAVPVFSVPSGQVYKGTKVAITCATPGAIIYYTTKDEDINLKYTGELTINQDCFIRAIAEKDGLSSFKTGVATASYTVVDDPMPNLSATVSPASGSEIPQGTSITITPSVTVDKILFKLYAKAEDGDNDQAFSATATEYSNTVKPIPTPATPVVRVGLMINQQWKYLSFGYKFPTVLAPTFSKREGEVQKGTKITIECATSGATIHYTLDGTVPTTSSTVYSEPIEINQNVTIKAIAVKQGMVNSKVAETFYTVPDPLQDLSVTVDPAYGSQIDQGMEITITPSIEVEKILFKLYATVQDGNNDQTFNTTATEYSATVKPVPTPATPVVRVGFMKEQYWKYFSYSYRVQGTEPPTPPTPPTPETVATPTFSRADGEVEKGTQITIECTTPDATIHYTLDGSVPTTSNTVYSTPIEINQTTTIKAIAVKQDWTNSTMAEATYTVKDTQPEEPDDQEIILMFNPASGSTVNAGTSVAITSNSKKIEDIFYMMFSSEEEAKETEWDQDRAQLYNDEFHLALSTENTTIKATYTLDGQTLADTFFYATYTVLELQSVELMFRPVSGSVVEDGTEIIVTANQKTDIYYGVYPDSMASVDAAAMFIVNAKVISEDGNPVITKGNTFLKCGVFDASEGTMKYFFATYRIKGELVGASDTVDTPEFSIPDGEVEKGAKVEISCATPDAMICYTLNGDEPTLLSLLYTEPIEINETVTIKAVAFKTGMKKSEIGIASYTLKPVANEGKELVGVSIYPNPNEGEFNISVPVDAEVEVFTANGIMVKRVNVPAGVNALRLENSGIYFVRVSANGQVAIKKVVVR